MDDDAFAQAIVATVIHYCGLLFEQPSELRYVSIGKKNERQPRGCQSLFVCIEAFKSRRQQPSASCASQTAHRAEARSKEWERCW